MNHAEIIAGFQKDLDDAMRRVEHTRPAYLELPAWMRDPDDPTPVGTPFGKANRAVFDTYQRAHADMRHAAENLRYWRRRAGQKPTEPDRRLPREPGSDDE